MTAKIANSIAVFYLLAALYAFAVAASPYVSPHANPVVQAARPAKLPPAGLIVGAIYLGMVFAFPKVHRSYYAA